MDYARRLSGRKTHNPWADRLMKPDQLSQLLGKQTVDEMRATRLAEEREKTRQQLIADQLFINTQAVLRRLKETPMTVSLYKTTAGGSREIVVQTNAQSLDVFISGLSDALDAALKAEPELAAQTIAATLRNAFPVAYAISGYKSDKVSESKLLTCGFASPDASELLAQSKV